MSESDMLHDNRGDIPSPVPSDASGEREKVLQKLATIRYDNYHTAEKIADYILAYAERRWLDGKIDAYTDCGSKGGIGAVVRGYAKRQAAILLSQPEKETK